MLTRNHERLSQSDAFMNGLTERVLNHPSLVKIKAKVQQKVDPTTLAVVDKQELQLLDPLLSPSEKSSKMSDDDSPAR